MGLATIKEVISFRNIQRENYVERGWDVREEKPFTCFRNVLISKKKKKCEQKICVEKSLNKTKTFVHNQ